MFDTTTQHGFAPLGMPGHQPAPYGQQFGQPQNAGFVPIIGLVPQSLLVNLVAQCLQQAQLAGSAQFGEGGVFQLEGPVRGRMDEDISPELFAPQHGENDCLLSGLDSVQIRAVTCVRHGHARTGLGVNCFAR